MASKKKNAAPLTAKDASRIADDIKERAEAVGEAASVSGTVTVALNYPRSIAFDIPAAGGGKKIVVINGNAVNLRGLDMGVLPPGGTFGLTFGVPAEDWEAIKAKYCGMPIFRNGLIFATGTPSEAKKEAETRRDMRNGFEPIDTAKSRTQPNAAE